jgi:MFS family permease
MAGIINPFWAKLADMSSRGWCLLAATLLYTIGYACTAGSSGIHALATGQVIYTVGKSKTYLLLFIMAFNLTRLARRIGNQGLSFIQTLILADITSLQNRGLVIGTVSLVYVPFAFVTGDITTAVGLSNWRWGVSDRLATSVRYRFS